MRFDWIQWAGVSAGVLALVGCGTSLLKSGSPASVPPQAPSRQPSGIRFEETARRRGLVYEWHKTPARPLRILDAIGGGCAFVDYDRDGWLDVLVVGPRLALFRNLRGERFEDVSSTAGLAPLNGPWMGCAVADYDLDGDPDLLITGYRRLLLLQNDGGTRFVDRTVAAGLPPDNGGHWGLSAGFMPFERNGAPDLVITNYAGFDDTQRAYCELVPGVRSGCPPNAYPKERPSVWRNLGGRFHQAREPVVGGWGGYAMTLAFADVEGDGATEFYVGNDGAPADLIRLRGKSFHNRAREAGVAFGLMSHPIAAMGADWGDYNRDGRPDLVVTAFDDEPYSLFRNVGGSFQYASMETGLGGPTLNRLGFGANWIDVENDGWLDLLFANGHVYDNASEIEPLTTFKQPLMLFANREGSRLEDIAPTLGDIFTQPLLGRGTAVGDFNNDGRQDVLVADLEGSLLLLENQSAGAGNWVKLEFAAAPPNTLGYGTRVRARSGGTVTEFQVSPARSFLSSSDPRIHIGLGEEAVLKDLTVIWPSGRKQQFGNVSAGEIVRVREGELLKKVSGEKR